MVCLKARKSRLIHNTTPRTDPSATVRYAVLTKKEMMQRMTTLHDELRKIKKQRDRLTKKLEKLLSMQSISLNPDDHNDMCEIAFGQTPGSEKLTMFQKIFWEQQTAAAKKRDPRGMRWHPLMIRWCIYLCHQSPGAYETLRDCIRLPSQRLLRDYTHHVKAMPGFSSDVDLQLYTAAQLKGCNVRDMHAILVIDEMHIKEDLVFDKNTGNVYILTHYSAYAIIVENSCTGDLIGFINMNEVTLEINSLENGDDPSIPKELLAKSMMTFMVRGLFTNLQFPYAYFPTRSCTGCNLFDPLWEAVSWLERIGFKVSNS